MATPLPAELAFRLRTAELRIDLQARIAAHHHLAQLRRKQRQRRENAEADQHSDRRKRGSHKKDRQSPRLHQRQRQIFGIVDRPVIALGVMLVVDAFVHEGRHEQRDADDQVPDQPETGNRIRLDVGQLMNEAACAVERQDRNDARDDRDRRRAGEDGGEQARIAEQPPTRSCPPSRSPDGPH